MEGFKAYAIALVTVCVCAGLVTQLAPEGELKKYLRYIVSLCVLAALISPVISVFVSLPELAEKIETTSDSGFTESESYEEQLISVRKKAVEDSIKSLIAAKFSLPEEKISLSIEIDAKNVSAIEIKAINIVLYCQADKNGITAYVSEMFYGTAKVTVTEAALG